MTFCMQVVYQKLALQARRVTSASVDAGKAARNVQGLIQGGSQNERVAGSRETK